MLPEEILIAKIHLCSTRGPLQNFPKAGGGQRKAVGGGMVGMREDPGEATPDTHGLPEYKVTKIQGEIDAEGHDIRLICGADRFKQLNWLYTVVCSPDDLLRFSRYCEDLALEAMNRAAVGASKNAH
jgi:hypothetical protein